MNTQQAIQPTRTLTSALDRLKSIDARLAAANEQSQRFLDALVGPKPSPGQTNTVGAQIQSTCFVSALHRLIDSIESEALKASRRAVDLLEAGGCDEADQRCQNKQSELSANGDGALNTRQFPRNGQELASSLGCV